MTICWQTRLSALDLSRCTATSSWLISASINRTGGCSLLLRWSSAASGWISKIWRSAFLGWQLSSVMACKSVSASVFGHWSSCRIQTHHSTNKWLKRKLGNWKTPLKEYFRMAERTDMSPNEKISHITRVNASICGRVAVQPLPLKTCPSCSLYNAGMKFSRCKLSHY